MQGPLGTFFQKLAQYSHTQGNTTFKINLNGGDSYYAWANQIDNFSDKPECWAEYLSLYLQKNKIDLIIVYGDCRYYHAEAAKVAKKLAIDYWVCEEGYLRAGFVTVEQNGCNANSTLDNSKLAIEQTTDAPIISNEQVGNTFFQRAIFASRYYWEINKNKSKFAHYHHHRPWVWWQEGLFWLNNFKQKFISGIVDPLTLSRFIKKYNKKTFLLPLQLEVDFQMRQHSKFDSVKESIRYIVESFAAHANKNDALLIKHHPQSRGFSHYGKYIKTLTQQLNISDRVLYIHQAHLPSLYPQCKGVVTVNSTVGLSAILHYLPTITLGKAIYNIPELTFQGKLDNFWQSNFAVNEDLFVKFQSYLQQKTQLAGDFYLPSITFLVTFHQKLMAEQYAPINLAKEMEQQQYPLRNTA